MRKVVLAVSAAVCAFSVGVMVFSMYNLSAIRYGRGFQEWPFWAIFPALLLAVLSALSVNANSDKPETFKRRF